MVPFNSISSVPYFKQTGRYYSSNPTPNSSMNDAHIQGIN